MGAVYEHKPVKLVASIFSADKGMVESCISEMVDHFGPPDDLSLWLPFDRTDYYEKEFGAGLQRCFICFRDPVSPDSGPDIKLSTNKIEDQYSESGKRKVNIDPGYITEAKLVLFTTKDYSHRIYLGKGIFAEVTLQFTNGSFVPWPWTYPDYSSDEIVDFFNKVRKSYMKEKDNY